MTSSKMCLHFFSFEMPWPLRFDASNFFQATETAALERSLSLPAASPLRRPLGSARGDEIDEVILASIVILFIDLLKYNLKLEITEIY